MMTSEYLTPGGKELQRKLIELERKTKLMIENSIYGIPTFIRSFNYQKEAARTISNPFFPENVSNKYLEKIIDSLLLSGEELDKIKKALFYGKRLSCDYIEGSNENLKELSPIATLIHSVFGIVTEAAEILKCLDTTLINGTIENIEDFKEELGDLMWYVAFCCTELGFDMEEVQKANIEKLKKRYPEKFTCEHAIKRLDKMDENI